MTSCPAKGYPIKLNYWQDHERLDSIIYLQDQKLVALANHHPYPQYLSLSSPRLSHTFPHTPKVANQRQKECVGK